MKEINEKQISISNTSEIEEYKLKIKELNVYIII